MKSMKKKATTSSKKRLPPNPGEGDRLQKVLAHLGLGSRREIEKWIEAGRVKVGGKVAQLGDRVTEMQRIYVDGKPIKRSHIEPSRARMILYHKPAGEICTRKDPQGRKTVYESLPNLQRGKWISIGRLDFNTSGLLLFTNDGELANKLSHPSSQMEREYAVRVIGNVDEDMLKRFEEGVRLSDGVAKFNSIRDAGGTGKNHWYHVVVTEGRNRLVRRMWESQDITISRLIRVRYGDYELPRGLKEGKWTDVELPKF